MPQIPSKLQKPLERVVVELCEHLPRNLTLLEKEGLCQKPTDNCTYCRQADTYNYFCNKKKIHAYC